MGHDQKISQKVFSLFLGSPCRETPKNAIKKKKKVSQLLFEVRCGKRAWVFVFLFFAAPRAADRLWPAQAVTVPLQGAPQGVQLGFCFRRVRPARTMFPNRAPPSRKQSAAAPGRGARLVAPVPTGVWLRCCGSAHGH